MGSWNLVKDERWFRFSHGHHQYYASIKPCPKYIDPLSCKMLRGSAGLAAPGGHSAQRCLNMMHEFKFVRVSPIRKPPVAMNDSMNREVIQNHSFLLK